MRAATPRRTPAPILRRNMRAAGAFQGRVIRTGRSPASGRSIVRPPVAQRTSQGQRVGQNDLQYAIQSYGNQARIKIIIIKTNKLGKFEIVINQNYKAAPFSIYNLSFLLLNLLKVLLPNHFKVIKVNKMFHRFSYFH